MTTTLKPIQTPRPVTPLGIAAQQLQKTVEMATEAQVPEA
ncbi:MAG: SAM-dependent methyltransferase, partial [Cyanothece sp. SIO2G6]|nr:SAM-dependent methyltransferase [Cyanothece sp. SIO2G6]